MTLNLFDNLTEVEIRREELGPGATILRKFALLHEAALLSALDEIVSAAPFRRMITPGGFRMSVAMTNCGPLGWVTDRSGYRYQTLDPESDRNWPRMPGAFLSLAIGAATEAGFKDFLPDACLINRYVQAIVAPGQRRRGLWPTYRLCIAWNSCHLLIRWSEEG